MPEACVPATPPDSVESIVYSGYGFHPAHLDPEGVDIDE